MRSVPWRYELYYECFLLNRGSAARCRRLTGNPELEPMHGRVVSRNWSPILAFTPRVHRMFGSNKPSEDDREFKVLSNSNSIDSVQSQSRLRLYPLFIFSELMLMYLQIHSTMQVILSVPQKYLIRTRIASALYG